MSFTVKICYSQSLQMNLFFRRASRLSKELNILPARYFIVIVKNIMLKGTGMTFIWKETLILAGMTLFFIIAATRRFKIRLNSGK